MAQHTSRIYLQRRSIPRFAISAVCLILPRTSPRPLHATLQYPPPARCRCDRTRGTGPVDSGRLLVSMIAAGLRPGGARLPISTTTGDLSTSECGGKKHQQKSSTLSRRAGTI